MRILFILLFIGLINTAYCSTLNTITIGDSMVSSQFPNTNYGSDLLLKTDNGYVSYAYSYLIFNISSIPPSSIITSATLNVYAGTVVPASVTVYNITTNWTESTVTYNNRPSYNTAYDSVSMGGSGWFAWNITGLTQKWYNDSVNNRGVAFISPTARTKTYQSRENTNKPYLLVTYNIMSTQKKIKRGFFIIN